MECVSQELNQTSQTTKLNFKKKTVRLTNHSTLLCLLEIVSLYLLRFSKTQSLKFKSQLTFTFFAAVSHLGGPLRKQNFTYTSSKGHGLWSVMMDFYPFYVFKFCVSRFVACDRNNDWRQRKTQLRRGLLNFRVPVFVKSAVILSKLFIITPGLECQNDKLNLNPAVRSL